MDEKLEKFQMFMQEVKTIEKHDEVLTSETQIERLTKPGSKYLNLNPYEVLLITTDMTKEAIKKQYRKMSILVHPDKNPDNKDEAQKAFDAVSCAHKSLEDDEEVKKIKLILEEADAMVKIQLKEKRKEMHKLCPTASIPEDSNPVMFIKFKRGVTCKLFADNDIKRQELINRQQQEKKRERENEADDAEKVKKQKEMEKQWEETRNVRVDDWRQFQTNVTKKAKRKKTFKSFKPPSLKPETR